MRAQFSVKIFNKIFSKDFERSDLFNGMLSLFSARFSARFSVGFLGTADYAEILDAQAHELIQIGWRKKKMVIICLLAQKNGKTRTTSYFQFGFLE